MSDHRLNLKDRLLPFLMEYSSNVANVDGSVKDEAKLSGGLGVSDVSRVVLENLAKAAKSIQADAVDFSKIMETLGVKSKTLIQHLKDRFVVPEDWLKGLDAAVSKTIDDIEDVVVLVMSGSVDETVIRNINAAAFASQHSIFELIILATVLLLTALGIPQAGTVGLVLKVVLGLTSLGPIKERLAVLAQSVAYGDKLKSLGSPFNRATMKAKL